MRSSRGSRSSSSSSSSSSSRCSLAGLAVRSSFQVKPARSHFLAAHLSQGPRTCLWSDCPNVLETLGPAQRCLYLSVSVLAIHKACNLSLLEATPNAILVPSWRAKMSETLAEATRSGSQALRLVDGLARCLSKKPAPQNARMAMG